MKWMHGIDRRESLETGRFGPMMSIPSSESHCGVVVVEIFETSRWFE
jgi:hypothetical protein